MRTALVALGLWIAAAGTSAADKPKLNPGGTKPIPLAPGFSPNPKRVRAKQTTRVFLPTIGVNNCWGYVPDTPHVVLTLDEPLAHVKVRAERGASVMYIALPGNKYVCASLNAGDDLAIRRDEWPAGTIAIYVGDVNRENRVMDVDVVIEDEKRPADLDWDPESAPELVLGELSKQPVVRAVSLPKAQRARGCERAFFRAEPELRFHVKRPLTGVKIAIRSPAKGAAFWLAGPIPEDARQLRGWCSGGELDRLTLDPGTYALFFGTPTADDAAQVTLLVRNDKTPRDPLVAAPSIPDELPLAARALGFHYPMLERDDVTKKDEVRRELIAAAPPPLFVFTKYDLDEGTATFVDWKGGHPAEKAPPLEYPLADEPLLVVEDGLYLTTDGLLYRIAGKYIAAEPSDDGVQLPDRARNPHLGREESFVRAASEDGKLIAALEAAGKKYDACGDKVWRAANKKIDTIQKSHQGSRQSRDDRIAFIKSDATSEHWKKCGGAALDKKGKETWAKLMENRAARRQQWLDAARKRLRKSFQ